MKKISFLILIIALFSFSCKGKKKTAHEIAPLQKGKIIENVACLNDKEQSYALYLPSYYNDSAKLPIIFAFDAHAAGLLPVELFKEAAEEYGYILIGSNNSKNGTPWPVTSAIFDTLLNEAHQRFSIDDKRIYTCGFSGGSRVASTLALTKNIIVGVIGCGAGFPRTPESADVKFDYFGIAGTTDFNLVEMSQLAEILDSLGYRNYLQTFNGKHEWPPKSVAHDAMLWLELNAMKDKLKLKNDSLVNTLFKKWKDEYAETKNEYQAYLLCNKAIRFLQGLCDVSFFSKENEILAKKPAIVQMQKHLKEIALKETTLQNNYGAALSSQTTDWWAKQTAALRLQNKSGTDSLLQNMYGRVLSYLSLAAYMNASGILKTGNYSDAISALTIYGIIDPENPEYAYLLATVNMKLKNKTEAMSLLEKAVNLGFDDINRLDADTVLQTLQQENGYSALRDKIAKNKK
jgi:hypothetical protein